MVDVANLATYCHYDGDVILEVLGPLRKCYVSSLLGLTTFPLKTTCCIWITELGLGELGRGNRGVTLSAQPAHTGSWEGTLGTQRDTPGQMLC